MHTLALFPQIGPLEVGILLLAGLLLFGRRLPEVGRGLGRSITEFKRGLKDVTDDVDDAAKDAASPPEQLPASPPASNAVPGTVASGETAPSVAKPADPN
ncbi:MAG: twin-arginine translocase TatA/TatE family subunit [Planctomycetota bacterium]